MSKKSSKGKISFKGRKVDARIDFQTPVSNVVGPHEVWYPKSKADVATAVVLLKDRKTFVRSGIQVVSKDVVDGTNGVVLDLSELDKVTVKNNELKVEPGASAKILSEQLVAHNLALPITDQHHKSIVSNVLQEDSSYLTRSLGPLSSYVTSIRGVRVDGRSVTFRSQAEVSAVANYSSSNAIITELRFEAVSAKPLWMFRKTLPYPGQEELLAIVKGLFLQPALTATTDLVLEAYSGIYDLPLVRISAFGSKTTGKRKIKKRIQEVLDEIVGDLATEITEENQSGAKVLEVMLESETGTSFDPTMTTDRFYRVHQVDDELSPLLKEQVATIHQRIAFGDNGEGKINKDQYFNSRLQVNASGELEITDYVYHVNRYVDAPQSLPQLKKAIDIPTLAIEEKQDIPNFQGKIYRAKDWGYKSAKKQYATSSYRAAATSPFMVTYPLDDNDVIAAIQYAKANQKFVVCRSGGHQYSGKSSGGKDTIVLSMDRFDHWKVKGDLVEVGPALVLTKLARKFERIGATIPHGECPYVAIGGHAQTGGYGHMLRCFGLLLDHIQSFDIILADGQKRTVTRPSSNSTSETAKERWNRQLFWGVLGGNAGSFGVVTKYTIKVVKDKDYPKSYGFSGSRRFKKGLFLNMMKEVQKWTRGVEKGTLPPDMDFMMTAASAGRSPWPIMLAELVHSKENRKEHLPAAFQSVTKTFSTGASRREKRGMDYGPKPLSELSDSFVRRWPATTLGGREFRNPYKKRVNCTTKALTNDFINGFVELISEAVNQTKGVQLIFQMSIGGGAYRNPEWERVTSIPHRDYVFCFVFDLFYADSYEQAALALQDKMQVLVDTHFSPDQELRVFWGSFGDTNISKRDIRKMYYNDEKKYAQLQQLKQMVDPTDVFHTSLTVQLPK